MNPNRLVTLSRFASQKEVFDGHLSLEAVDPVCFVEDKQWGKTEAQRDDSRYLNSDRICNDYV